MDGLQPLGGVSGLRRLADRAQDLIEVLDAAAGLTWTRDGALGDIEDALAELESRRPTLEELSNLDFLADRAADLARPVRLLRQSAEDLWTLADQHNFEDPHDGLDGAAP